MDKKEVVGFIPNLLFKLFLYLKDRFDPKTPISDEEKITFEICNKLVESSDSKLLSSPISGKRFIKNEKKDIFVSIETNVISLTNTNYTHSCYINDTESYNELVSKFDECLDMQRIKLENEIKNHIKNSLQNILTKLS